MFYACPWWGVGLSSWVVFSVLRAAWVRLPVLALSSVGREVAFIFFCLSFVGRRLFCVCFVFLSALRVACGGLLRLAWSFCPSFVGRGFVVWGWFRLFLRSFVGRRFVFLGFCFPFFAFPSWGLWSPPSAGSLFFACPSLDARSPSSVGFVFLLALRRALVCLLLVVQLLFPPVPCRAHGRLFYHLPRYAIKTTISMITQRHGNRVWKRLQNQLLVVWGCHRRKLPKGMRRWRWWVDVRDVGKLAE